MDNKFVRFRACGHMKPGEQSFEFFQHTGSEVPDVSHFFKGIELVLQEDDASSCSIEVEHKLLLSLLRADSCKEHAIDVLACGILVSRHKVSFGSWFLGRG